MRAALKGVRQSLRRFVAASQQSVFTPLRAQDKDLFGRQDPYCVVTCGSQTFRTRTAKDAGRNPVWNETFRFNVLNENEVVLLVKDEDVVRDDVIGTARISLARARVQHSEKVNAPVIAPKSGKNYG